MTHSIQGWARPKDKDSIRVSQVSGQDPSYLSHHLLPLKMCLHGKLELKAKQDSNPGPSKGQRPKWHLSYSSKQVGVVCSCDSDVASFCLCILRNATTEKNIAGSAYCPWVSPPTKSCSQPEKQRAGPREQHAARSLDASGPFPRSTLLGQVLLHALCRTIGDLLKVTATQPCQPAFLQSEQS